MSERRYEHPPVGVSLEDWFDGAYDEYAVLLQPFHLDPTREYTEQERKSAPATTWKQAAGILGLSPWEVACAVHTLLDSLSGAPSSPNEHVRLLQNKCWALPPEDQIGSGVERIIGRTLLSVGATAIEVRDEFDIGRETVFAKTLLKDASVFHSVRRKVEPVAKVISGEPPVFFAAASDWPHVLVCGRGVGVCRALYGAGAEFLALHGDERPRSWWHQRKGWAG